MKFRLNLDKADVSASMDVAVKPRRKKKHRPGPAPTVGGKRMNFLPGDDLRRKMNDLCAEAKRDFKLNLNKSYILREGGYDQIKKLRILFQKARNGQLGPKQRKDIFADLSTN